MQYYKPENQRKTISINDDNTKPTYRKGYAKLEKSVKHSMKLTSTDFQDMIGSRNVHKQFALRPARENHRSCTDT